MPVSVQPGGNLLPRLQEARLRHARCFASRLRSHGDAFTRDESRDAALAGFFADWSNIETAFQWAANNSRDLATARICVDFVHQPGLWLLDVCRPVAERVRWLELALPCAKSVKDAPAQVSILNNLGIAQLALGSLRQALSFHKEALRTATRSGDGLGQCHATGSIGICYRHLGKRKRALLWQRRCLHLAERGSFEFLVLNAVGNIGTLLGEMGNPVEAIEHFKRALELARRQGRRREEGYVFGNIGKALLELDRHEEAICYLEKDLAISRELQNRRGEANALGEMGNALLRLNEFSRALEYHEEQTRIADEIGQPLEMAQAALNLTISRIRAGKTQEVSAPAHRALALYRGLDNPSHGIQALERIAAAHQAVGGVVLAIEMLEDAISICRLRGAPGLRRITKKVRALRGSMR